MTGHSKNAPAAVRHTATEGGTAAPGCIAVRFLGGALVPGLPDSAAVDVPGPVTVDELMRLLEPVTGVPGLKAKLERYYAVLVDGTSIQHLAGWSTLVAPGAGVSVVAPMGGGAVGL